MPILPARPPPNGLRQIIDAQGIRTHQISRATGDNPNIQLNNVQSVHHEVDLNSWSLGFSTHQIDELHMTGQTTFELPGHGNVQLSLLNTTQSAGMRITRFQQADLVGTLTQRGEHFFLNLPTNSESYRVQGNSQRTMAVASSQLAQRLVGHEEDFRNVE